MKKIFTTLLLQFLFVFVLLELSPAHAVPIVSIQPSSTTVALGDSFTLEVSVSDVVDLFGFQFDVSYSPSLLSSIGITEGAFLSGGGATFFLPGTIDNLIGTISFTADTLLGPTPGVTGTGTLASIDFMSIGNGISTLTLSNVLLLDSALNDIAFSMAGATVEVLPSTAVPEPGSFLLMMSGLLSFPAVRRLVGRRGTLRTKVEALHEGKAL